jgi:hypothetical protein
MMGFLFGGPPQPGMRGPQAPHQYGNYQHAYPHQGQYAPSGQAYPHPLYNGHQQQAFAQEQATARQQHVYSEQYPVYAHAEYVQPEYVQPEYAQPEPRYIHKNAGYNRPVSDTASSFGGQHPHDHHAFAMDGYSNHTVAPPTTAAQPGGGYVHGNDTVYDRGTLAPYPYNGPQETNDPYMTQPVNPYAETDSTAYNEPVQGYHAAQPDPHTLSHQHQHQHTSVPHHTAQHTPQEPIHEQYRHGHRPPVR